MTQVAKYIFLYFFILSPTVTTAQDSFNDFRNNMLKDYGQFRKSVLDGYAEYLANVWKEYDAFRGVKRDIKPKPTVPPNVDKTPAVPPQGDKPIVKEPAIKPEPQAIPNPQPQTPQVPQAIPTVTFAFYGNTIKTPRMQSVTVEQFTPADVANAWRAYQNMGMVKQAKDLLSKAQSLGMNDWFTYEMVRESVNSQCKGKSVAERAVLQHFILANMGYDIRLANCEGEPALLIQIKEQVYGRPFLKMDEKKYYIYPIDAITVLEPQTVYTCDIPDNVDSGRAVDMMIGNGINLGTGENHTCTLKWKDIVVTGKVDRGTMEMLRHYPQIGTPMYAISNISPELRKSVLQQLKSHINGLTPAGAANKLLHFVQHAFEYSTDDNQHGYEKPYFFEENFYYPKNDCEDRAIFYAYLVRNLLGLEVHLIHYPGHECTAICFGDEKVEGTGYIYQGKTFVICDPTFIGAGIGHCMPNFVNTKPEIELW